MAKTKLSFTIVTYNNSGIIESTINNLLENIPDKYSYQFFVVDNKSNDRTIEILKNFKKNIQLISLDNNKGFGYGHNRILDLINSEYHFVVNPDIKLESIYQILNIVEYLDKNDDIGLLVPLILNTDLTIQKLNKRNPTVFDMAIRFISPKFLIKRQKFYTMEDVGYESIHEIEYASGCFMVFRTKIFKKINGFDENFFMYLEDADITRRAALISRSIFYPKARVIHIWERSGHKRFKFVLITIKSMIYYFNKWGWRLFRN